MNAIAQRLACSTGHISKMVGLLQLPLRRVSGRKREKPPSRQSQFIQKRDEYRAVILVIAADLPDATRTLFHERAPRQMQWLMNKDREWLNEILPKGKSGESKLDWKEIDSRVSACVEETKKTLIDSQKATVYRITKIRLMRALRIDPGAIRKGRCPKTADALKEATETSTQYRVRRLFWMVNNPNSTLPSNFGDILLHCPVPVKIRSIPFVAEAVKAAEEIFEQKKKSSVTVLAKATA